MGVAWSMNICADRVSSASRFLACMAWFKSLVVMAMAMVCLCIKSRVSFILLSSFRVFTYGDVFDVLQSAIEGGEISFELVYEFLWGEVLVCVYKGCEVECSHLYVVVDDGCDGSECGL
jgi:hypothetical protein